MSFHFVTVFYQLPRQFFDDLVRCAISALGLQERYSLVAASTFLVRTYDVVTATLSSLFSRSRHRFVDGTDQGYSGERRSCGCQEASPRHAWPGDHALLAHRFCRRFAEVRCPKSHRVIFGRHRKSTIGKQGVDSGCLTWGQCCLFHYVFLFLMG